MSVVKWRHVPASLAFCIETLWPAEINDGLPSVPYVNIKWKSSEAVLEATDGNVISAAFQHAE